MFRDVEYLEHNIGRSLRKNITADPSRYFASIRETKREKKWGIKCWVAMWCSYVGMWYSWARWYKNTTSRSIVLYLCMDCTVHCTTLNTVWTLSTAFLAEAADQNIYFSSCIKVSEFYLSFKAMFQVHAAETPLIDLTGWDFGENFKNYQWPV